MKDWFKIFGLSFFSNKIACRAAQKSILNFILGFIFTFAFLLGGMIAGDVVPFYPRFNEATEFRSFAYNAFLNENGDLRVRLRCKDSYLTATVGQGGPLVIDTYANKTDAENYSINGYNLVVDTRATDALDKIVVYAYLSKDEDVEITYESYLQLPAKEQSKYELTMRYTAEELVLTDEVTAEHEAYLNDFTDDSGIVRDYAELKAKKAETDVKTYRRSVYWMYLKAYCPALFNADMISGVPLFRNFYFYEHLTSQSSDYLMIFQDMCMISFTTDSGVKEEYFGFYDKLGGGNVALGEENSVDSFLLATFSAYITHVSNLYFVSVLRYVPVIFIAVLLAGGVAFAALKLLNCLDKKGLGGVLKVTGTFMFFSALFTALFVFVLGFFIPRNLLFLISLVVYIAIFNVRTIVLIICEKFRIRKAEALKAEAEENDGKKDEQTGN